MKALNEELRDDGGFKKPFKDVAQPQAIKKRCSV